MSETKLPLEILREKYIPVEDFPKKYNIPVAKVLDLIKKGKIRKAEFPTPDTPRRSLHANYEEVLKVLEEEKSCH